MKRITLALLLLFSITTFSQSSSINYKALIKDAGGAVVASTGVTVQFTILKGVALAIVYQETHTPSTDANGIVVLNIGEGTIDSGVFATIDWGSDDHFLNTKIDTGTGLTDLGTTPFMAVPYALHAKTATAVLGNSGTTNYVPKSIDGLALGDSQIFDNGVSVGIGLTVPTAKLDIAGNVKIADGTQGVGKILTSDAAGLASWDDSVLNLITALQAQIADLNTRLEALEPAAIGDLRAGGVVFWVDPADNTHGLVCAIQDQGSGIQWYNGSYVNTGTTASEIGTGTTNTDAIIAAQGLVETDYAAGLARAYTGGGFTDWFLPSIDELNEMYANKAIINASASANGGANFMNIYWSSTEDNNNFASVYNFNFGSQGFSNKANTYTVRAVRTF